MIWIFISMFAFTAALLFIASASRNLSAALVSTVVNGISALIPIVIVLSLWAKKSVHSNKFGIAMAAVAGCFIAAYGLALSKSYAVNKVGIVTPIIFGGTLFLTTILGMFIFKEKVSPLQGVGLAFLLVGVVIITYARATAK